MRAAALPTPVEIDLASLDLPGQRSNSSEPRTEPPVTPVLGPASTHSQTDSIPVSVGRFQALDAARAVATFGIIWTHVAEANHLPIHAGTLGRFGTSFYIIAAALFVVRTSLRPGQPGLIADAKKRAVRLLVPYLVWCVIYGLYYGYGAWRRGQSWESLTFWWGPVAGTAIHLWFLPFIFFWGVVGAWLAPRLARLRPSALFIGGTIGCAALYALAYGWVFYAVDRYWLWDYHLHRLDRWIDEVPLFFTALTGGVAYQKLSPLARTWIHRHLSVFALGGVGIFLISQIVYGQHVEFIKETTGTEGRFLANLAGLGLLGAFLSLNGHRLMGKLAPIGQFTYLAFLCHMLVLEFLRTPMTYLPGYGSIPTAIFGTLLVFAVSVLVSWTVTRVRWLSFLRP